MRKLVWVSLVVLLITAIILGGCTVQAPASSPAPGPASTPTEAKTWNLKYAGNDPPDNINYLTVEWFAKEIEKRTNGKVKITIYKAEALGKAADMPEMLKSGVCDMAGIATPFVPGAFPMYDVSFAPGLLPNAMVSTDAFYACWYAGIFDKEFAGYKVLWEQTADVGVLFLRNKKITKMEELKGMVVRAVAAMNVRAIEALGGSPISMPSSEVYTALQKGTMDGLVTFTEFALSAKLNEVCKYICWYPISGVPWGKLIVMNPKVFSSMPGDIQTIIMQLSNEARYNYVDQQYANPIAAGWANKDIAGYATKAGFEVYSLSPEENARWDKALAPVIDSWIKDNEAKGLPAKKAVDIIRRVVEDSR